MRTNALHLSISRAWLILPLFAMILLTAYSDLLTPKTASALDSEEQTFLATINGYRAQHGLGPLTESPALNGVARWMANDMATNNYFSHADSLGRDPFVRMDQLGYAYNTWRGENLVAGTESSAESFRMWSESPPHNENMLGEHYTVIGIARAHDPRSVFGWYWATEFGGQSDVATPPPPDPAPAPAPAPAPVQAPAPEPAQPPAPAPPPQPVAPAVPVNAPPPAAPTATPSPAPTPRPVYVTKHSGLLWEGVPSLDFRHKAIIVGHGSFISNLLNLAKAMDRLALRVLVRY